MLIASAAFRYAAPADVDAIRRSAIELTAASRSEPGVLAYAWSQDLEDPLVLRVLEVYDDLAALERHLGGEALSAHLTRTGHIPKQVLARHATDGGRPVDVAALRAARTAPPVPPQERP